MSHDHTTAALQPGWQSETLYQKIKKERKKTKIKLKKYIAEKKNDKSKELKKNLGQRLNRKIISIPQVEQLIKWKRKGRRI